LERAGRVADFLEFGELLCRDALMREESCGGHFRIEHQTSEGEAKRDDENFTFVGVWEYKGDDVDPELHKEDLVYEEVKLATRSYK
jgi:succinate dehydrogenase / fumarate reductase flavoprotein subunit